MKLTNEVTIFGVLKNGFPFTEAKGSVGSARASGDLQQFIGCQTTFELNNASVHGICWARTADGREVRCDKWVSASSAFVDQQMLDTMRSVNPTSLITFSYQGLDTVGTCQTLSVENGSLYRPTSP